MNVCRCAVTACANPVMRGHLMCPSHWRRVPRGIQLEVYRTHQALRGSKPATVRGASREYRAARELAVKLSTQGEAAS